ncbi:MAG TPA: biosynthetic peptidoglycan transglycosylase [Albitalea sp.]
MPHTEEAPSPATTSPRPARLVRRLVALVLLLAAAGFAWLVADELQTSRRQAEWLASLAARLHYEMQPGRSEAIRFPGDGPFDKRLGYHQLPGLVDRLEQQHYGVVAQARMSPTMIQLIEQGLFPIYPHKTRAGLEVLDCRGQPLYEAHITDRSYDGYDAVPPLLVEALLFIENRELLAADAPATRNPAVDWRRVGKALVDHLRHAVDGSHQTTGGSTLATQIEKYRHSTEGRTATAMDKLRQMVSASLRAYMNGEDTRSRRRQIVVDYLNTVPLAAQAGFGEVHGIGDGLWAWYGREFGAVNELLFAYHAAGDDPLLQQPGALAFKQALSLMIAQRRPSHYLLDGEDDLRRLTDSYLRVMAEAGIIPAALRDAALELPLHLRRHVVVAPSASFVDRKAANAVRGRLQSLLAMPRAYDVDRLDLTVGSTLDAEAQRAATAMLRSLREAPAAKAAGLVGHRLLAPGDDPAPIAFSFTLYERGAQGNLLRVQADNLDQPFDLNDGARLDLGSTAKLRTLVTYLELVAQLHARWSGLDPIELAALPVSRRDPLGRWARDHLAGAADTGLPAMLEAAMQRRYPASPHETFMTGGGLHRFENFDPDDNARSLTVREAFTRSVNLVFIRMMRDIVHHVMARDEGENAALLDEPSNPRRGAYLARFADQEGRQFLARFHRRYAGRSAREQEDWLLRSPRLTPRRLAAALYAVEPTADDARLAGLLERRLPAADRSPAALAALREAVGPGRWSLPDQGYLAGMHPLELWMAGHLRRHPDASLADAIAASREERQAVYGWLFKTRHKGAQDARIRHLLEVEAFTEVHRMWQRLGYPFAALTPSYASAIGASGDRPAALAELMGIVVNGGMRLPTKRIASLHFARATPYETRLAARTPAPERVIGAEVAEAVRGALVGVVEQGTAKRLKGALVLADGKAVAIGAKTGTGDHRHEVHGAGGRLVSSRVVGRSATLVFLIGDRHFGTVMAHVREPHAADYKFTSALVVQLLKAMTPALRPMLEGGGTCSAGEGPRRQAQRVAS